MLKKVFFCSWTRQSASTFSNWRKKSNGNVLDVSRSLSWVFKIFKTSSKFMNFRLAGKFFEAFQKLGWLPQVCYNNSNLYLVVFCYSKPVFASGSTVKVSFAVIRVCWHRTILVWQVLSFFQPSYIREEKKHLWQLGKIQRRLF